MQRESNFELLRIVSMLLLIAHHFCVHSGILNTDSSNKIITFIFLPVGKICFVAFIAISMWFLVDKSFKATRWLKTWCEVFFYSVTFCLISLIINKPNSFFGVIHSLGSSFFPIAGNSHGFASSYLLFYLLFPFISKLMSITNKKQHIILLGIVFYAQIFEQILNKITFYSQPIFSELLLFVFCYLLMFCLKKYPIKKILII